MLGNDKIETIVIKIQKIYLLLTCLGFVLTVFVIFDLLSQYGIKEGIELTSASIIYFALYLGLAKRKKWLIPFILFAAAIGFFRELIFILHPAESLNRIAEKVTSALLLLFYGYQIHFFPKTEVKKFFRTKGSILFGSV